VQGFSHAAFRAILPYFIAAYKSGNPWQALPGEAKAIVWYRTTPANCGPDAGRTTIPPPFFFFFVLFTSSFGKMRDMTNRGPFLHTIGTRWGQGGIESAAYGAKDVISVLTVTNGPVLVTVEIGDNGQTFEVQPTTSPFSYLEIPFDGRSGPVRISMEGKSVIGPDISNECPPCGHVRHTQISFSINVFLLVMHVFFLASS
jgi:glucan endo-1,3-alpha-glucosidase